MNRLACVLIAVTLSACGGGANQDSSYWNPPRGNPQTGNPQAGNQWGNPDSDPYDLDETSSSGGSNSGSNGNSSGGSGGCRGYEDCSYHACRCRNGRVISSRTCYNGSCLSASSVCPVSCEDNGGW